MSRRRNRRPQPTTDQRTPEERLEALVREPNRDRAERMLWRIREDLDATLEPGPWIAAARSLSERLITSEDTLYYFAELFTDCVVHAASTSDPELARLGAEVTAIERAHGLREHEFWHVEDAPEAWRLLADAWDRRATAIVAAALRESGNADIAAVCEQDRAAFNARSTRGQIDVWGEDEEDNGHLDERSDDSPIPWRGR